MFEFGRRSARRNLCGNDGRALNHAEKSTGTHRGRGYPPRL